MRVAITFLILLLAGASYAAEKYNIGKVSFRFYDVDKNGRIPVLPLIPPELKVKYLRGEKTAPTDIMECNVMAEKVQDSILQTGESVGYITVLKCNETYYTVTEIDFVVNK